MKVTREFIIENCSTNGGWNNSQILMLGEDWPPRKGWIERAIGTEISDESARLFIEYGKRRPKRKERIEIRKEAIRIRQLAPKPKPVEKQKQTDRARDYFLASYEWRKIRMEVLIRDGAKCACCGTTPKNGRTMHVDHIKPRKAHPELALTLSNLQVLCDVCNHGKGNWDRTDWRAEPELAVELRVIK